MEPTPDEAASVARALKRLRSAPATWRPVSGGGHTPARRWIVVLRDGTTAFVKVATDDLTASWLRDEHVVYSLLRGKEFMPGYVGFSDDGERPALALEDLSGARWPPPWNRAGVEGVRACLARVAATSPPEGLPLAADDRLGLRDGWSEVARDPEPFLRLGLCSVDWLHAHLGTLRSAAASARLDGDALLHLDVRSGNICVPRDRAAVLVDWNVASVGNALLDVAFWLPSFHAEGGPPPHEILPGEPELAALVAGYFCSRAGRPPIPSAARVRATQLVQARAALPWAARALGLPSG
jgi:hypothetical protein